MSEAFSTVIKGFLENINSIKVKNTYGVDFYQIIFFHETNDHAKDIRVVNISGLIKYH